MLQCLSSKVLQFLWLHIVKSTHFTDDVTDLKYKLTYLKFHIKAMNKIRLEPRTHDIRDNSHSSITRVMFKMLCPIEHLWYTCIHIHNSDRLLIQMLKKSLHIVKIKNTQYYNTVTGRFFCHGENFGTTYDFIK